MALFVAAQDTFFLAANYGFVAPDAEAIIGQIGDAGTAANIIKI